MLHLASKKHLSGAPPGNFYRVRTMSQLLTSTWNVSLHWKNECMRIRRGWVWQEISSGDLTRAITRENGAHTLVFQLTGITKIEMSTTVRWNCRYVIVLRYSDLLKMTPHYLQCGSSFIKHDDPVDINLNPPSTKPRPRPKPAKKGVVSDMYTWDAPLRRS